MKSQCQKSGSFIKSKLCIVCFIFRVCFSARLITWYRFNTIFPPPVSPPACNSCWFINTHVIDAWLLFTFSNMYSGNVIFFGKKTVLGGESKLDFTFLLLGSLVLFNTSRWASEIMRTAAWLFPSSSVSVCFTYFQYFFLFALSRCHHHRQFSCQSRASSAFRIAVLHSLNAIALQNYLYQKHFTQSLSVCSF